MSPEDRTGLAKPDHDEAKPAVFRGRERDEDRKTRKPLESWDRVKLLILFLGGWLVMYWAAVARYSPADSETTPTDVLYQTLRSYWWLLALAGAELVRQVHYILSERYAGYHQFWIQKVFGRFTTRAGRMSDWTRYRVARVLKILFVLLIVDLALAKVYGVSPALALIQLPVALMAVLPFALQLAFAFFFIVFQFVGLFWFLSRGGIETYMPDDIKTRFEDVKGQDAVLDRVKENIIYLERPEEIEEKGGYVPGGILLWGPPGTGKTLMAEAVAGETGRPFVFVEPAAFINMFFGVGVLKVKGLYRKLRKLALRYGGVIVFFDEADSLGNRGSLPQGGGGWNQFDSGASPWTTAPSCNGMAYLSRDTVAHLLHDALPSAVGLAGKAGKDAVFVGAGMGGGGMGTLQALLAEMSGLKKPRGFLNRVVRRLLGLRPKPPPKYRILHMFATNMPQALDEAMLRPGRIDRIYKVGYPSKEGRKATFEYYLDRVRHELTDEQVDKLATISPYATGASIKDMVNEGLTIAIREGREAITWQDIIRAKHLKEHGLPDDTEYVERERHAVAIHEACHAVVAYRLRRHAVIDVATIERRGDVGGFVSFIPPEDQFVNWRSEYEVDIMCSLASLAGERLFFDDDNSAGVAGDLRNATAIATRMEAYLGMGDTVGSHYVTKFGITAGRSPYAAEDGTDRMLLETELGRRVEGRLQLLVRRTNEILEHNRREILAVAHALETHKTMSGDDVAAIIEGHEGPLVDGRQYAAAHFDGLAEDYHAEAVTAHKAHAKIETALPVLTRLAGVSSNGEETDSRETPGGNGEVGPGAPRGEGDGSPGDGSGTARESGGSASGAGEDPGA